MSGLIKKEKNEKGSSGWLDKHFEWRKFFKNELITQSTFKPQKFGDYIGYSGTVLAVLLLIQFTTGLLLLFYYKANPVEAFASLEAIRNEVPNGFLFTNIHSINSNLILLLLFVHMFRIMLISAHRGPREPQWYTGGVILAFMLITGFSGYLLPWSQQSYWACVIGTESVRAIPLVGDIILRMLRGGENVGGPTLSRFFAFHVTLLPIGILVLVWLHIKMVWRTGVIAPTYMHAIADKSECINCGTCRKVCQFGAVEMLGKPGKKLPDFNPDKCNACRVCLDKCPSNCISLESRGSRVLTEPIFPQNVAHRLLAVFVVITTLFTSVYFLHGLLMKAKTPANPLLTPDRIKPEWYFLASYQLLRELPSELIGLLAVIGIYLLVLFLPKLDKTGPREPRKRPVYMFLVGGGIAIFIILTIIGWMA